VPAAQQEDKPRPDEVADEVADAVMARISPTELENLVDAARRWPMAAQQKRGNKFRGTGSKSIDRGHCRSRHIS
jgi:hypothetical protein